MGGEPSLRRLTTFLLLILCLCDATMSCIESEMAALLKLKQSLTDPLHMLSSWTGADCCNWTGVSCSSKHRGRVVRLNLANMSLGGEIGPSVLKLQQLRSLNLSMNDFGGTQIPGFFGSITNLKYLDLSNANFGGKVPHQLGNLSTLLYLDLGSETRLQVDDLGWISGLSSLTYLDMSSVSFMSTGSSSWFEAIDKIPSLKVLRLSNCLIDIINPPSLPFFNLTSLSVLDLSWNGISSTLPGWLSNITRLTSLDLSKNQFTGPIPDAFGKMTSLSYLDLSLNHLEGEIPPSFGNLCSLRFLYLSGNNFSGGMTEFTESLSRCYSNSPPNITVLDLSFNSISGPIPSSIEKLSSLQQLLLQVNQLSGTVPVGLGQLSSLQQLWLQVNQLSGIVPVGLGQLSMLTSLRVSRNPLVGTLSEDHFANMTSLVELLMSHTALTFKVSSTWVPPFLLQELNVRSTPVGPSFPPWLQTQKGLLAIDLSDTGISDELPDWFWGITSNALVVNISNNQLEGSLPSSLVHANIMILDLSSNQLSGNLPPFNPAAIEILNLRNNKFSGTLPNDIGHMMSLGVFQISGNQFSGSIPPSICKMNKLKFLVLADNNISGTIPDCWTSSQIVAILDLRSNNLSGAIPKSLGSLASSLAFLHLNHNNLIGELPTSLKNCTKLKAMDLGQNNLSGSIPYWIGESLSNLVILRLRSNIFIGGIPHSLSALSSLTLLDLANNRLSGIIPRAFANLTALMTRTQKNDSHDYISSRAYYNGVSFLAYYVYTAGGTYKDSELVYMKGRELEYSNTLALVRSMDLSSNQLSGVIPEELTALSGLMSLNLSDNRLGGPIPKEIGNLRWLESLDLSRNNLSGTIPPTISALTSLSRLNLSYNKLMGEIPQSPQLQTLDDDASIYIGNDGLCGRPLEVACNSPSGPPSTEVSRGDEDDASDMIWFFSGMAPGCAVGFLGIWSVLLLKNSWRYRIFKFTDDVNDCIYVTTVLKVSKLRRRFSKQGGSL